MYSVVVKNTAGEATSGEAQVVIYQPITITEQPVEARVIEGETASFIVGAQGTEPIEYSWRFNSEVIDGATGPELKVENASKANEGSYQVVMKNPGGSAVSEEIKLTVVQPVTILDQTRGGNQAAWSRADIVSGGQRFGAARVPVAQGRRGD